jgi:hypothetical protein
MPANRFAASGFARVYDGLAAGLELAANEVDDDAAILIGDPAPHAVHGNEVEIRQIGAAACRFRSP